jgi:hypothetical protein
MTVLVVLGFGAFFLSSLAIGLRLLDLARRNRELPELLIGLGILGIGPAGFALMVAGMLVGRVAPGLGAVLMAVAQLATAIGAVSAFVFTWQVFRKDERWARMLVGAAVVLFATVFFGRLTTGDFALPVKIGLWFHASSLGIVVCMLWGSYESLRYYTMMRRRETLGLADPLVTNRFLLWGLGIGSAGVGTFVSLVVVMVTGVPMQELDGLTLSNSMFGLTAAVLMWVAFLPPAAYRRFIERRAAAAGATRGAATA